MMSYFQFLLLSLAEKKQYLQQKGTFLLDYVDNCKHIEVYAVSDFFVEFHKDERKGLTEIISFKDLSLLEQHAQHVDLTQITNLIPIPGSKTN